MHKFHPNYHHPGEKCHESALGTSRVGNLCIVEVNAHLMFAAHNKAVHALSKPTTTIPIPGFATVSERSS